MIEELASEDQQQMILGIVISKSRIQKVAGIVLSIEISKVVFVLNKVREYCLRAGIA